MTNSDAVIKASFYFSALGAAGFGGRVVALAFPDGAARSEYRGEARSQSAAFAYLVIKLRLDGIVSEVRAGDFLAPAGEINPRCESEMKPMPMPQFFFTIEGLRAVIARRRVTPRLPYALEPRRIVSGDEIVGQLTADELRNLICEEIDRREMAVVADDRIGAMVEALRDVLGGEAGGAFTPEYLDAMVERVVDEGTNPVPPA